VSDLMNKDSAYKRRARVSMATAGAA
jgi:hypothetical protein